MSRPRRSVRTSKWSERKGEEVAAKPCKGCGNVIDFRWIVVSVFPSDVSVTGEWELRGPRNQSRVLCGTRFLAIGATPRFEFGTEKNAPELLAARFVAVKS